MKYILLSLITIFLLGCSPQIMKVEKTQNKTPLDDISNGETVILGLAGDVMLGRLVNDRITLTNYEYPWGDMLSFLKSTDINLINLETTFTKSEKKVWKAFNFKADPDKIEALTAARIDVVNLANNHILDFSEEGLIETIKALDDSNIKHVGAGIDKNAAKKPVIIKRNNISIGIIGYTDNEPSWEADTHKSGTNYLRVGDIKKIEKDISEIREKVDILIFTIHWGPNMRQKPSKSFQEFAHKVIDLGVDIFHGHSAHIFQGIEVYDSKLILYDTGDFVDDYYVTPSLRNDRSFFYIIEVSKKGVVSARLIPVLISKMQVNKAKGEDYAEIVSRISMLSKDFNTEIKETEKGVFVELY